MPTRGPRGVHACVVSIEVQKGVPAVVPSHTAQARLEVVASCGRAVPGLAAANRRYKEDIVLEMSSLL